MTYWRLATSVALVMLAAALMGAAPQPDDTTPPPRDSLVGQLLVATPEMDDPRLAQTVILMVRHDKSGAFGIVINRPVGEQSLKSLLAGLGIHDTGVHGRIRIFYGGPVEPDMGFILHSTDYHRPETVAIDGRIAMTASPAILRDIGHGVGPAKRLLAFGYAGWGPGQLEGELAHHDWYTELEEPKLVFDDDRAALWTEALQRRAHPL